MIVVDASAVVKTVQNPFEHPEVIDARRELAADTQWLEPDHWFIESMNAVRGLALGRKLTPTQADRAVKTLAQLEVEKVPLEPLAPRIWELRHNLTEYDAAYVAVAEHYGLTLVTGDKKIKAAGVARCPIIEV